MSLIPVRPTSPPATAEPRIKLGIARAGPFQEEAHPEASGDAGRVQPGCLRSAGLAVVTDLVLPGAGHRHRPFPGPGTGRRGAAALLPGPARLPAAAAAADGLDVAP